MVCKVKLANQKDQYCMISFLSRVVKFIVIGSEMEASGSWGEGE